MCTTSKFKFLLSFVVTVILFSACIPSLHPIYTESTREVDDRLLGTWSQQRTVVFDDIRYDVTVSDEGDTSIVVTDNPEGRPNSGPVLSDDLVASLSTLGRGDKATWTFEQASVVTFKKIGGDSIKMTIDMRPGVPSFLPDGYEIEDQEVLPYYILTHRDFENGETVTTYLIVNMTKIGDDMYLDFMPYPKGDKLRQGAFGTNYIAGHTFSRVSFKGGALQLEGFNGEYIERLLKSRRARLRHERVGVDGDIVLTASTKELRSFINKYCDNPDLFDSPEVLVKL